MKKKYLFVLILLMSYVSAQEPFLLEFKFKPDTQYLLKYETKTEENLKIISDSLSSAELKKYGIETFVNLNDDFMLEQHYVSSGLDTNDCFNVDLMLKDYKFTREVKDEETDLEYEDFMKTAVVRAVYHPDGEFKVKEVTGENIPEDEIRFFEILNFYTFRHFIFPDTTIRAGDSFSTKEEREISLGKFAVVKVKIINDYKFEKTEDSKCYYSITSDIVLVPYSGDKESMAKGEGKGKLIYNTKSDFIELYNVDLEMYMENRYADLKLMLKKKEEVNIECEVQRDN